MTATINVLAGIAGRGKTARMLQVYREFLLESAAKLEIGRSLWLTPTHHSAAWVRGELLGGDLSACFHPNVLTFAGFAERILRDCPEQMISANPLVGRTLIRRIVENMRVDGTLRYFANIAATSGFIDQVSALISELKRGEIWPEHFEEAISAGPARARDAELAAIYAAYQERLLGSQLYDGEGRFWSARDQLTRGHWGGFAELSLVVVDGFSDFTRTQYEILGLLTERAERVFVTLPLESPLRRGDLFAKPEDSLRQLQSRVAVELEYCESADEEASPPRPPALRTLSENLFDTRRAVIPAADADGVEILAMTGQVGEVRAVVAAIKKLLLSGVHPSEIVVAFRSANEYADIVNEVFADAGIPFVCETREPLSSAAIVKAFMAVLHLEAENWPFRRLRSLLDSSYFAPDWPEYAGGAAARDVAAQLRRLKLRDDRRGILDRLERMAGDETSAEDMSPRHAEKRRKQQQGAKRAKAFLSRLSETLGPLRRQQTMRAWAESLMRIARELRIDPRTLPRPADERDAGVWSLFEKGLFSIAAVDEQFSANRRTIGLKELLAEMTDLLHGVKFAKHEQPDGQVRVLDATQVRNLEVPYLFVGGLTETSFPARRGDDCFYSEADRREFNNRGLPLQHRTSHTQDEMMLFYGVVTRARRKLTVSYPAANTSGQPLLPSPYLLALRGLFAPGAIRMAMESSLDPIPPATGMLTAADLRVVAMDQALQKQPALLRSLWERPEDAVVGTNLLAAVDAADQRFRTHDFTHYEGMIPGAKSRAILSERFSLEHQFSATELEAYASCPFRFFLKHVLNVLPLDSIEVETDQRRRGILVHDILTHLHRQFAERAAGGDVETGEEPLNADALSREFQALIEKQLARHGDAPGLQDSLDEIELRMLVEWGEEYGKQWTRYQTSVVKTWDVPLSPLKFEIAFGAAPGEDRPAEGEPSHECLVLGVAHRAVRVRGRIDRIDAGTIAGRAVFNVVDYKTGKSARFRAKDVSEGHAIQLPLYALAAERLGIVAPVALPLQMGYWFVKETGYKSMLKAGQLAEGEIVVDELWETRRESLEELISQLVANIRQGCFPVYNSAPDCGAFCPYKMTCRVNQIRPLEESLHKTWTVAGEWH